MTDWYWKPSPEYFDAPQVPGAQAKFRFGGLVVDAATALPVERVFSERQRRFLARDNSRAHHTLEVFEARDRSWFMHPARAPEHAPAGDLLDAGDGEASTALFYYTAARLEWARRRTRVAVAVDTPREVIPRHLETVTKYVLCQQGPAEGTVLFHGAALVPRPGRSPCGREEAFVLAGRSGIGKSTLSHIAFWSGRFRVLADEILMLRFERGRCRVSSAPFGGTFSATGEYPVRAFLHLHQASEDRLEPLSGVRAMAELAVAAQYGNFHPDLNTEHVSAFMSRVASDVPCYCLFSKRGDGSLNLLQESFK
ncbi:MAG: hypothetical protein JSV08_10030 [Acidobacteriota bacterium]|nr:MAG: hypothetical protein JSV08_10030 [Acidobacteriota bacterium]